MLKRWSAVIVILLGAVLAWWYYPSDFGANRPPKLPLTVPIAEGEIVKSHEEIFETGKGYIIETRSPDNYEDVIAYYQDQFTRLGYEIMTVTPSASAEEEMVTFVARKQDHNVVVEIVWNGKLVYVTTVVHLHKWILT